MGWKTLETRILEEPVEDVFFNLPDGTNEVAIICKTMQERSDGENLKSNRFGSILVNDKRIISNVSNYSGYNSFITTLAHIKNLTAYIDASCVALIDPSISKGPVSPAILAEGEEIKKIQFTSHYTFVSGLGNVGRFSAGSEFSIYYR